ncbi:MAG TPA: zinc metallopeptidase [Flammeovirgaceae bacterium]|nr:zinc metallopeptidase [Flammeovirgaceae bacterium]
MGLIVIFVVFMIISLVVNGRLKSKFKKYSQIPIRGGLSGREVAEQMLADNGIHDVKVVSVPGHLTDHYNPANKTVNLSPEVYEGRSIAAAAVAAHECGHAVQHATAYKMLALRSALVPLQAISAKILNFLFIAMFFGGFIIFRTFPVDLVLLTIIGAYGVFTLFAFVTLPVEFDASRRALAWIEARGIVTSQEYEGARDALKWAAMTYVVVALSSLATLLYYIMVFLGNRD